MPPSVPIRRQAGSRSVASTGHKPTDPTTLLGCFLGILASWEGVFPQSRTLLRAVRQAVADCSAWAVIPYPASFGPMAASTRIGAPIIFSSRVASGNWWPVRSHFAARFGLLPRTLYRGSHRRHSSAQNRLRIQQAFVQRDPLSPKYHVNFMLGLRFLQASVLVPLFRLAKVGARAIPIAFEEVSVVKRPRHKRPRKASGRKNQAAKCKRKGKAKPAQSALQRQAQNAPLEKTMPRRKTMPGKRNGKIIAPPKNFITSPLTLSS